MERGTRLACDTGVPQGTWSKDSDRVVLVRHLQSLASDVDVEEPDSELGQSGTFSQFRRVERADAPERHRSPTLEPTATVVGWISWISLVLSMKTAGEVVQAARNRLLLGWKIEDLHEGVGKAKKLVETARGAVRRVNAEMTGTP